MKKLILISLFFALVVQSNAQTQYLVSSKYSEEQLAKELISFSDWRPFPKIDDRTGWAKADSEMMKSYLAKAEQYLNYQWPSIPATKSLLYVRTGNRSEYQDISFQKRTVLGTLLMAEIYENKGRFIDQIVDGIWSICEESYWGIHAHLPSGPQYKGLVDVRDPVVDLFAAETASLLAWTDYFIGDRLDSISPQIRERIYYETDKRIFEPAMNKAHWWMGEKFGGHKPNNWNPWICSNWLCAALLLEENDKKRTEMVYRITEVLDEYLNLYPEDGGCDEGPGYWNAAPASVFDNIAMLNLASNDAFNYVFDNIKIKNMARYIYRVQIGGEYFVNFADAAPKIHINGSMVYRFGKAINDKDMMSFGAYFVKDEPETTVHFQFFRNLYEVFIRDEIKQTPQRLPLPKDAWFPDLQVMVARDQAGSDKGFFVAAKGGNNKESHNHNDVGNFIVYYNGLPLLIDVGSGTYTRKTFSDERYDIWSNCSDYHNLPTINNNNQSPGHKYKATNVSYNASASNAQFSLDLSKAYAAEAGINSLKRTVLLKRGKQVSLTDVFKLSKAEQISEHFMTVYPTELTPSGQLVIHYQTEENEPKDFIIQYDSKSMTPSIEKIKLKTEEDQGILEKWGDRIYRINFEFISPRTNDQASFLIKTK